LSAFVESTVESTDSGCIFSDPHGVLQERPPRGELNQMNVAEKTEREIRLKTKPEAVLYSRAEAAAMLSVSARTLDYWIEKSLMRAVKLGRRRVGIPATEVKRIAQSGIVEVRP
jgi:excisionase family DNA binding protein